MSNSAKSVFICLQRCGPGWSGSGSGDGTEQPEPSRTPGGSGGWDFYHRVLSFTAFPSCGPVNNCIFIPVAVTIEILGWGRAWWCKGPRGGGGTSCESCCQGTGFGAALQHPGAGDGARVAHGARPGLCTIHDCVFDSHRFPEDDVCHGLTQLSIQERGVPGEDQPVHGGTRFHKGSTQGEDTTTWIKKLSLVLLSW